MTNVQVLISADMEGATGVTGWKDVEPGQPAYERFRKLLTADVNAAVEGAFDAGATGVVVNEAHDGMRNILIEDLDQRAEMISGLYKPLVMMEGVQDCDLAFFVGYHARAGEAGVLAHTLCGAFASVELNGEAASEARLCATVAGLSGVPVGLVSGDDVICAEAEKLFPGVRTAVVKQAIDTFSARCVTPRESGERIRAAARLAVTDYDKLQPYRIDPPFTIRLTLCNAAQAGTAATLPGVTRDGPISVILTGSDFREVYAMTEAIGTIAGTVQ
jgi:D-amino peptidase